MNTIGTIMTSIGSSIVATLILSVALYWWKLKHVPEDTKALVETMLNERLGNETNNHNAVLSALNPDNKTLSDQQTNCKNDLSKEHSEIKRLAYNIDKTISVDKAEQKSKYALLDKSQQAIADSAEKIKGLSEQFQDLNKQLVDEKSKNAELQNQLTSEQDKNKDLQQEVISLEKQLNVSKHKEHLR